MKAEEVQKEAYEITYAQGMWYGSKVTALHSWWCFNVLLRQSDLGSPQEDAKTLADMPKEQFAELYARWQLDRGSTQEDARVLANMPKEQFAELYARWLIEKGEV